MRGVRLIFGVMAIGVALVCYVVFGQFLINVAGLDWAGVPRRLVARPGESAIGFGILIAGTVFLVLGVGFVKSNDPPP